MKAQAGGVEELCQQLFLGFYKSGYLAGLREKSVELSCPFDRRRNGVILGEGASVLVLEELSYARQRCAPLLAELKSAATGFGRKGKGITQAIAQTLREAGGSIDAVIAAANSTQGQDAWETAALKEVLSGRAKEIPVTSIKSSLGELFSASGAFTAAAAVCCLEKQMLPPTLNYEEIDPRCDLRLVTGSSQRLKLRSLLVNAAGAHENASSALITTLN